MGVDQQLCAGIVDLVIVPGEMNLRHPVERKSVKIIERTGSVVFRLHEDIVDVEQQPTASSIRKLLDEFDFRNRTFGKLHVSRRIFQQHLSPECDLHLVDVLNGIGKRLFAIGKRQEVIVIDAIVRRPGEMLRKAFRAMAANQLFQASKMIAVERPHGPDRKPDAMDRERITFVQSCQLCVRRATLAHVILSMNFEKTERLLSFNDLVEVLCLEAYADGHRQC